MYGTIGGDLHIEVSCKWGYARRCVGSLVKIECLTRTWQYISEDQVCLSAASVNNNTTEMLKQLQDAPN